MVIRSPDCHSSRMEARPGLEAAGQVIRKSSHVAEKPEGPGPTGQAHSSESHLACSRSAAHGRASLLGPLHLEGVPS